MFRGDPRRSRVMSCCASAVRIAISLDSFYLEFPEMRLHFLYQLLYERGAGFLRTDWASFNVLRGCILQWVRLTGGPPHILYRWSARSSRRTPRSRISYYLLIRGHILGFMHTTLFKRREPCIGNTLTRGIAHLL